jgi:two-component system, LytTR family, response regulator
MIRTLIVDDAAMARQGVRLRLAGEPDVEIVGEAADGPQAIDMIGSLLPDLVYLDVQMPGCDGFQVLECAGHTRLPAVIFVTAHDQYAVKAFEAHAIDYLLKPVSDARFRESLNRARHLLKHEGDLEQALARLSDVIGPSGGLPIEPADDLQGRKSYLRRIVVKDGNRFLFVRMDDVNWIQADENYIILHTQERPYQARVTMKQLEDRLDPANFVRIHRSVIVNIDRIIEVLSPPHQDRTVVLKDGTKLPMGRAYAGRLLP